MYLAWMALAAYLAVYFPVFVALTRTALRRFRAPLWLAAPAVWVGLEFLRAHLMTGFAWYFLGHTQYRWASIIQICDVVGVYGVSFIVAMANASLALVLPLTWLEKAGLVRPDDRVQFQARTNGLRRPVIAIVAALATVAAAWVYGAVRLGASSFEAGPRIGLIQGNFTTSLKHDPDAKDEIYAQHRALMGETIPHQPDVIVWPETMFPFPMFQMLPDVEDVDLETVAPQIPAEVWKGGQTQKNLERTAEEVNAALIIGVDTLVATRQGARRSLRQDSPGAVRRVHPAAGHAPVPAQADSFRGQLRDRGGNPRARVPLQGLEPAAADLLRRYGSAPGPVDGGNGRSGQGAGGRAGQPDE
jgi:apolipoprotein N-acyltransferase